MSNSARREYSIVPPQTPENVAPLVISYVEQEFAKLKSKNTLKIEMLGGGKPWIADYKHWNYEAATRATEVAISCILRRPAFDCGIAGGVQAHTGPHP